MHEHRLHERCACRSSLASSAHFADRGAFVLRGTERVYERPRPFQIEHIALDLTLDHEQRGLSGVATLRVARVAEDARTLRLDAVGFTLGKVELRRLAGKGPRRWTEAKVVYDGDALEVEVPRGLTHGEIRIAYAATPRRGMYFLAPDEEVPHRPEQLWTQCQDEDARFIFPCHDKPHSKQSFDIKVRVRPGWFVLSNGDLKGSARARKRGEFHYVMPDVMPSYLFTIVAGRFATIEDDAGELPVSYHVPEGQEEAGRRTFASTPEMIALFARLTGVAYPWSKYAQIVVHDFIFGGMENVGATTMYEHILLDERAAIDASSDDLIAHELAHQWFGDLVTCRDWSHAWLNEGFATYFEHVWRQHHLGEDEYLQGVYVDLVSYLGEAGSRYRRPVVCQDYENPIDLFDRHLYEKGGLVLHGLRQRLGDEVFWRGIHLYLERHRGGVVETRDLMRALEEVSGASLEQDFEQGVFRAGHPDVSVKVGYEEETLVVTVKQTLEKGARPWCFDLEIDVRRAKGRKVERLTRRVDRAQQTFAFPFPERPRFTVVDPRLRIVGRVETSAPADLLRRQLLEAPTGRGQSLAAHALAKRDDPETIAALGKLLGRKKAFWGARGAAARALGRIRSDAAFAALKRHATTDHPKVRRAVMVALGNFRTDAAAALLAQAARHDESVLVASSASRALGSTRRPSAYDALVELLDRDSWADVLRAGALGGLAELRDERGVELVKERTRYGVPNRGRRAAITALPTMASGRAVRELLVELLDDPDPYLRGTVVSALGELGDAKSRPGLRRALERELDGRVRRRLREVLRDLSSSGRREQRRLRESVDVLQRNLDELEARFSKLEAKVSRDDE